MPSYPQRPLPASSPERRPRHRRYSSSGDHGRGASTHRRPASPRNSNHPPVQRSAHERSPRRPEYTVVRSSSPYFNEKASDAPVRPMPSPYLEDPPIVDRQASPERNRRRNLVRPERQRIDRDHPNYYYRKHAQNMDVQPSTTGNDPMLEELDEQETQSSNSTELKSLRPGENATPSPYDDRPAKLEPVGTGGRPGRLRRHSTATKSNLAEEERLRRKQMQGVSPPSLWNIYCHMVTFWCPDIVLRCFGKVQKAQQRAWREKMGLISIILLIMAFVGFLTFGFTAAVCPNGGGERLQINSVGNGYLIIHGQAYDLSRSHHPAARGIADGANVLFDLPEKHGGKDASFMFQNVNGACKGLITKRNVPNNNVPSDSSGNLAWYMPCVSINQDGSSQPNFTDPVYAGYACHTSGNARSALYGLKSSSDVYFTWDDIKNSSRNLMVWGGSVLDLDRLAWINQTAVSYPARFDQIRNDPSVKGIDVTRAFASSEDKRISRCFSQIIKVGSIDTDTIGCIASKVVLYVSLVFILSIVVIKFLLALIFQWFLSRNYAAKTPIGADARKRNNQIEEWADDIYQPPPKLHDPAYNGTPEKPPKRSSAFLPTTSRFTSPYDIERAFGKGRPVPTTMASQSSTSRLLTGNTMFREANASELTVPTASGDSMALSSDNMGRSSVMAEVDGPGPAGFVHESVVPQPPPEWQPFGYPLAHAICLVTCYSEGQDGIRTTLDSVATTDYPNSHKLIAVVCDGMIKGKGEEMSTPDICLGMMKDHAILPNEVQAFSYVAVASGSKRHNMAKIYSGFYDYGDDSVVPPEKQQRVPMMIVVKCGTPDEANKAKPGNRGKRDSQIILMSFLQKVMFDERMTELEYEMFNGIWKITGISPDFYEIVLMVDADTKIFPDSLTHMISAMVKDPEIMGLCGETKIANKRQSWVSMIQVFEYFISHHLNKSFESVFGGVTCLPGCFCMYRIKAPKGGQNYWVPILANPDVVEHYSENVVDTLHKKNLLLLGEDRYLSTLMLKTFPKRKQVFVPQAVCKTTVPDEFKVLLSQRRRWINSTVHNLMELVLVRDLCGTFCFSMQFVVFIELVGTLVLPAAISFTLYLIAISIKAAIENTSAPTIPLVLLALILGLPGFLIVLTAHRWSYVVWMLIYLLSLPIWNFVLPTYAYWKFDDFSWGDTRKTAGEKTKKAGIEYEGEFDSSKINMKRWGDFEQERRLRGPGLTVPPYARQQNVYSSTNLTPYDSYYDY